MTIRKLTKLVTQQVTRVKSVDYHPVKPVFIIGLHDGKIQSWDCNSISCVYEFIDHESSVRSVKFHPQGDFFVSGGDDKKIRMWDYTNRVLLKKFKGHTDFIRCVDFHPSKPWIISASDDQSIKIWNFMTGKCIATATGHSHYVMSARFCNDTTIISGSLDNTIRVWNCEKLQENRSKFVPGVIVQQIVNGHDRGINFVNVSNNCIITGGDDREVKIWEYDEELKEKQNYYIHQGCVTSGFSVDDFVCSVGEDGNMVIYNIHTHKYEKYNISARMWTVASRNNMFVVGHDNGFDILQYSEPTLFCNTRNTCYYYKDTNIYSTDLETEQQVCKAGDSLVSMHVLHDVLLLQYEHKYEVVYSKTKIHKGKGQACLVLDSDLVVYDSVMSDTLDGVVEGTTRCTVGRAMDDSNVLSNEIGNKTTSTQRDATKMTANDTTRMTTRDTTRMTTRDTTRMTTRDTTRMTANDTTTNNGIRRNNDLLSNLRIVTKQDTTCTVITVDGTILQTIHTTGDLIFGGSKYFYISNSSSISRYTTTKYMHTFNIGQVQKVHAHEERVAFVCQDKISVYDALVLVNQIQEVVNIVDGFWHDNVFIYSTTRHLKYIFEDAGVIRSIDEYLIPFLYRNGMIYYYASNSIMSEDCDITEIEFKKKVFSNLDITPIIKQGSIPGLSPLCFLIKQHRGDVALPYIRNMKQRFELLLSNKQLQECMDILEGVDTASQSGDVESVRVRSTQDGGNMYDDSMYYALLQEAYNESNIEICEKCLTHLQEWYDLFLLYLCTDRIHKLQQLLLVCDKQTENVIRLYIEDKEYFGMNLSFNSNNVQCGSNDTQRGSNDTQRGSNTLRDSNNTSSNGKNTMIDSNDTQRESNTTLSDCDCDTTLSDCNNKQYVEECEMTVTCKEGSCVAVTVCKVQDSINENVENNSECKLIEEVDNEGETNSTSDVIDDLDCYMEDLNLQDNDTTSEDTTCDASIISQSRLNNVSFTTVDVSEAITQSMDYVTNGEFNNAIALLRNALYTVASNMSSESSYTDERRLIGVYVSGLETQILRKKTQDSYKQIVLAKYFSSLPLDDTHKQLALLEYIQVCYKNKNYKTAKCMALQLEHKESKIVKRVLATDKEDTYEVPHGVFCIDVLDYKDTSKVCAFCYVCSHAGDVCSMCLIGVLN